jgi:hypothetical protein
MNKKKNIAAAKTSVAQPQELLEKIGEKRFTTWAIAIYLVLTVIFFRTFIFSDNMFYGTDTIPSEYMKRTIYAEYVKQNHEMMYWDPYILGGLPFIDAMHGDIFYPTTILQFIMDVHRALGWKLIVHVFLAGVFMFFCLKEFKMHSYTAFLGGLLYMFTPNFVTFFYGGHDGKIFVIALFPLMFWTLQRALTSRKILNFLVFGATVGLSLLTSHIQMTYFALWGLAFYFVYYLINEYVEKKDLGSCAKLFAFFWTGIALGLGIGMIQFLPPYLYVQHFSVRAGNTGYEHAASWSMHPEELFSLVIPEFVGYLGTYWGQNPFRLNYTGVGIIVLLLMTIRLIAQRGRLEWTFFGLAMFFLLFAMGGHTPVHKLAYYLVPGVKIFRGPEMSMFLFGFFTIFLAALGLDTFFKNTVADKDKILKTMLVILAGFAGLVIIIQFAGAEKFYKFWISAFSPEISDEKGQAMARSVLPFSNGLWIALVMVGGCIGLLYGYARQKMTATIITGILGLLIVVDLWRIDTSFVEVVNPQQYFARDAAINQLIKAKGQQDKFRVYPVPGSYQPNFLGIFGIESVGGFHDNEIKWYHDFRNQEQNFVYKLQQNELTTNPFLNLLNVKYILYRDPKSKKVQVFENAGAMPRVFFASRYEVVNNPDDLLVRLRDERFDYRHTVLFEEDPKVVPDQIADTSASIGTAKIDKFTSRDIVVKATMQKAGFLVLSENYFPYWKAYIDGKETKIYKTDYTLRSVFVPAGEHQVKFIFTSKPYNLGKWVTFISILLFVGIVGGNLAWKKYFIKGQSAA